MIPLLALALWQGAGPAPDLPLDARASFHRAFVHAVALTSEGSFDKAEAAASDLPGAQLRLAWDDSAAPTAMHADLVQMRDFAINAWVAGIRKLGARAGKTAPSLDVSISDAQSAGLRIRLVEALPPDPQGLPMAERVTPGAKGLDVEIGLRRGSPAELLTPADVFVEVARAIGVYLGVADSPLPGTCMFPNDAALQRPFGPGTGEMGVAAMNLDACARLRQAIAARQRLTPTAPKLSLRPMRVDLGNVPQARRSPVRLTITNEGDGRLDYQIVPDCGCFSYVKPGVLKPGAKAEVETLVNTTGFIGTQHKILALYSNDPVNPSLAIPVTFRVVPPYRLYRPGGDVVILGERGGSADVLLALPSGSKLKPLKWDLAGVSGAVSVKPWSGVAPDAEMGEGPLPRRGYLFHVTIPADIPAGRDPATLQVQTDDPENPAIQYTFYAQKGIQAMPDSLYLGDMAGAQRASLLITRPGKPFRILSVSPGSAHLTAATVSMPGGAEYRIDVIYDGQAPKGDFLSVVKVRTSDPSQREIDVSVSGTVR